jgi:hypothetical protein
MGPSSGERLGEGRRARFLSQKTAGWAPGRAAEILEMNTA